MKRQISLRAPAKVNLHLEVLDRRPDGYHDIRSLLQMVSLADELCLSRVGTRDAITIEGDFDFPQERNIVSRAVLDDLRFGILGKEAVRMASFITREDVAAVLAAAERGGERGATAAARAALAAKAKR